MNQLTKKDQSKTNNAELRNASNSDMLGDYSAYSLPVLESPYYSAEYQDSYSRASKRPVVKIKEDRYDAVLHGSNFTAIVEKGVTLRDHWEKAAITFTGKEVYLKIQDGAEIISDAAGARMRKDGSYVANFGKVKAADDALDLKTSDDALIFNYGTLESTKKKGIDLKKSKDAELYNDGKIYAWTEGVEMGDNGYVYNSGEILSEKDDAINMSEGAKIDNFGTILTDEGDAIDVDSGEIFNANYATIETRDGSQGAIDIDAAKASLSVTNYGLIRGGYGIKTDDGTKGPMDMQAQFIENHGRIIGFQNEAITLNGGNDVVALHHGSNVSGTIDMGIGNDVVQITSERQIINGKIHGGDGYDVLSFKSGFSYSDITHVTFAHNSLSTGEMYMVLSKTYGGSTYSVTAHVDSFEHIVFDDTSMSFHDFYLRKAPRPNGYQIEDQTADFAEPVVEDYIDWGYL